MLAALLFSAVSLAAFPQFLETSEEPGSRVTPAVLRQSEETLPPLELTLGSVSARLVPVLTTSEVVVRLRPGEILDVHSVAPGESTSFRVVGGTSFGAWSQPEDQPSAAAARGAPPRDEPRESRRTYNNINVTCATQLLLRRLSEERLVARTFSDLRIQASDGRVWSWADRRAAFVALGVPQALPEAEKRARALALDLGLPEDSVARIATRTSLAWGGEDLQIGLSGPLMGVTETLVPTSHTAIEVARDEQNSLDPYSNSLQYETMRRKSLENDLMEQEARLRSLGLQVAAEGSRRDARRFERVARQLRKTGPANVPPQSKDGEGKKGATPD